MFNYFDEIAESVDFQGLERGWVGLIYRFSIKRKSSRSGGSYYRWVGYRVKSVYLRGVFV